MLQIKLGAERVVDAAQDALGRQRVGYWKGMSEQEAWESGRCSWVLKAANALNEAEVQIISPGPEHVVLARAVLVGLTKDELHPPRFMIEGRLLKGHPAVGKVTDFPHPSQNSIRYV